MMVTLRVKNETGAAIKLGGTRIGPATEIDVPDKDLKTPDFAGALRAGNVSIVTPSSPTEEQIRLAREVLPGVLTASIQHLAAAKSRFDQSRAALVKLRDAYIRARAEAEARFTVAKEAAPGWKAVRDAVQHVLISTKKESDALKAAKAKLKAAESRIKDLVKEDLDVTNRSRERWFADRTEAEKDRDSAYEELTRLEEKAQAEDPVARQLDTLKETAEAVAALDKDKALGKEIPPLGS